MGFRGFPAEAIAFFEGLEADNSKAYWQANKAVYEAAVRGPMEALLADLDAEFGPFHLFRANRDIRFSKDKSPYKTHIGAVGELEGGSIVYVQLSSGGLMAAAGYYQMASDQLDRFREAVADDGRGGAVVAIVADLERAGYAIGAHSELKTAPRGYAKDHPRIELLRRRGLVMSRSWPVAKWLHTPRALDRVRRVWVDARPLEEWLDTQVGPSTLPPDDLR